MLHHNTINKKAQDIIKAQMKKEDVLSMFLLTSKFEAQLQQIFQNLINTK